MKTKLSFGKIKRTRGKLYWSLNVSIVEKLRRNLDMEKLMHLKSHKHIDIFLISILRLIFSNRETAYQILAWNIVWCYAMVFEIHKQQIRKIYPSDFDLLQFFLQKCSVGRNVPVYIIFWVVYISAVPTCKTVSLS